MNSGDESMRSRDKDRGSFSRNVFFQSALPQVTRYPQRRHLTPEAVDEIIFVLANNLPMQHLDLSCSDFGDDNVRLLAKALTLNTSLLTLNLSNCQMTDTGLNALVRMMPKNDMLVKIDVSFNLLVQTDKLQRLEFMLQLNEVCGGLRTSIQKRRQALEACDADMPENKLAMRPN
jgi:hypothetical protein